MKHLETIQYPDNIQWLTPEEAEEQLISFRREEDVHIILVVQMKDESYTLLTLLSWVGRDDTFLDASLADFEFGMWDPQDYLRIAVVSGQKHIYDMNHENT